MTTPVLQLLDIRKRFGSVSALQGADFTLSPGELHALLGENGAGKTTLMQIAYGLVRPDAGAVRVAGMGVAMSSPRVARNLGIGMVHQHFTLIPALTVADNVALFAGWPVSPRGLRERVRALGERVGLRLDPAARAGRLSVGLKQRLEILKALASDARILLLDEPTALLAPGEAEELLAFVRRFTASGGSAVLITHKLDEALAAADRITVLREGRVTFSGSSQGQTPRSLAEAMVGETRLLTTERRVEEAGLEAGTGEAPVLVRLESVEVPRERGYGLAVRPTSIAVSAGEIVGLAAVEGNGQREMLRAVAGRIPPLRGKLTVASPVGFIPEDRTTEGLIPDLTLTENIVLGSTGSEAWLGEGRVDWRRARRQTAAIIEEFEVAAPSPDVPAGALSGGNQQKLVVGRELSRTPRVVVAENPTRGLDLRATDAIHRRLRAAAAGGAAVLFHSTDLDEVLRLATRVLVVARGVVVEAPTGASRAQVGELMVTGGR